MSFDEKKLYELLPAIYRIRDAELASDPEQIPPLQSLLKILAQQAGVLEENVAQLYDDQFAETCVPWVLPYLGDLLGIKGLPSTRLEVLNPRAEVAHTIGYRRRKGTAAMLEQLARDVTNWPARAVEFFQLLATTQYLNHPRRENQSFMSVRGADRLEYLGSAFEHATNPGEAELTHSVDVRRIASQRGRYNIPNVGIFLWRLRSFALTRSPAVPATAGDQRRFFFSPLGCDQQLFNLPATEDQATHLAEPINVPDRIRRRVLKKNLDQYYGKGKSLLLERPGANISSQPVEIAASEIIVCNLSGWIRLPADKIAIDPVLGRIAFPDDQEAPPLVTFHYGFSANMGGGEYNRLNSVDDTQARPIVKKVVNTYLANAAQGLEPTINAALSALGDEGGAVEILNSGRYEEKLSIDATGKHIVVRAADKRRATVVLGNDLEISGEKDDEVILDGLLIVEGKLRVTGQLGRLRLRHCTLVPGISLDVDGKPKKPAEPSLIIESKNTRVEIDHSILGPIRATEDAEITIQDSIIDATSETNLAYGGTREFGAPLRIANSTVIGRVRTTIMRLASNTIFLASFASEADRKTLIAPVLAQRRQDGCARFSYLSPGARAPVRYHCQPETDDSLVRPRFASTRFVDAAYCQLSVSCSCSIRQGADDESEMGAFHNLYQLQRETHLRARVQEYLRFGLEAGIFYVT